MSGTIGVGRRGNLLDRNSEPWLLLDVKELAFAKIDLKDSPHSNFAGSMMAGRLPVSLLASATMCSVPPGPLPGLPSQGVMNETLANPQDKAECNIHLLHRSYMSIPSGVGPSSSGMIRNMTS